MSGDLHVDIFVFQPIGHAIEQPRHPELAAAKNALPESGDACWCGGYVSAKLAMMHHGSHVILPRITTPTSYLSQNGYGTQQLNTTTTAGTQPPFPS